MLKAIDRLRYRAWKKLMIWQAESIQRDQPLVGFPFLMFLELELDTAFEQGGYECAKQAAREWVDNFGYVPVDQHGDPVARDLMTLPTLSDLKLWPNLVNPVRYSRWYQVDGVLYASRSEMDSNLGWFHFPLWSPSPKLTRQTEIISVPENEKSISKSRGFYWRKDG